MALDNLSDLEAEWAVFMENKSGNRNSWTQDQKWRADNPGEFQALLDYRQGGTRPTLITEPGRRMVFHVAAYLKAKDEQPPPPPPTGFGANIPQPPITAPVGSRVDVSTLSALQTALAGSATWIRITQPITVGGDLLVSRTATSSAPLWLEGGKLTDCRVLVRPSAAYFRMDGIEVANGWDGVKCEAGSHHIVITKNNIHNTRYQGILVGGAGVEANDVYIAYNRIHQNGEPGVTPDAHGIYVQSGTRGFIGGNLIHDYDCYGIQLYPDAQEYTVVNNTIDTSVQEDGGPVVFDSPGLKVAFYGNILSNSRPGYEAIRVWGATLSGSVVADNVAWAVSSPSFPTTTIGGSPSGFTQSNNVTADPRYRDRTNRDYHLLSGSPAINHCAARPEFVMPYDMEGKQRQTADAGCFAF